MIKNGIPPQIHFLLKDLVRYISKNINITVATIAVLACKIKKREIVKKETKYRTILRFFPL